MMFRLYGTTGKMQMMLNKIKKAAGFNPAVFYLLFAVSIIPK